MFGLFSGPRPPHQPPGEGKAPCKSAFPTGDDRELLRATCSDCSGSAPIISSVALKEKGGHVCHIALSPQKN